MARKTRNYANETSERYCKVCGLPMSFMDHDPNAEPGDDLGPHYVCDGPNDNTDVRGCWSVEVADDRHDG